jgi:calcineurin-like phosphoesterase family protein
VKRVLVGVLAAALMGGAALLSAGLSGNPPAAGQPDLVVRSEARNPWTHLRLNNDPGEFQFAVVSDRTGGHRARIFSRAVEQLNLLQPEFVLSVGDLIEGYTTDQEKIANEWREFQTFAASLRMPFFYVPGNHDLTNPAMEKAWKEKFGRRYYHFVYRGVLFLMLCTEDPPGQAPAAMSAEQAAYVKQTLAENPDVHWTVVCLHKPVWVFAEQEKVGWKPIEDLLAGRPYTVFAGHVHRYQKYVRNGQNYYQLATTGGGSKLRGTSYGEFDHVAWVTMKKDGPVLANVLLDGVLTEDLRPIETDEPVKELNRKPTYPTRGTLFIDGVAAVGVTVALHAKNGEKWTRAADARTASDGSFVLSTYTANDGAPAGEFKVTLSRTSGEPGESPKGGKDDLSERYGKPETSPLTVTVKSEPTELTLEATTAGPAPQPPEKKEEKK